jgi:hypothetical protein
MSGDPSTTFSGWKVELFLFLFFFMRPAISILSFIFSTPVMLEKGKVSNLKIETIGGIFEGLYYSGGTNMFRQN